MLSIFAVITQCLQLCYLLGDMVLEHQRVVEIYHYNVQRLEITEHHNQIVGGMFLRDGERRGKLYEFDGGDPVDSH